MIRKTLTGLALMLMAAFANAQSADSTQAGPIELTLEKAKQYAMEHNRTVQASDLSVKKAEAAKWEALSNMLVTVDATLSYQNFLGFELNFGGQAIPMPNTGNLGIQAAIAFNGQILVGYQLSKMAIDMQNLSKQNDELTVKNNVTTSYLTVLIAEESYKILKDSRDNLEKTYNNVNQLAKVGMTEQTQADQLKVQLMSLDNQLRSAQRNIELAYNALRLQLGTSADAELDIQEDLNYYFETTDAVAETLDQEHSLDNNISIQLLEKNIELQEKQVTLKRWAYGPTLSFAWQYSGKTYFGKKEGLNMQPPNVIVATLNVPIFSSGKRYMQVKQQKIAVDIEKTKKEEAIDGLRVQERQLTFNLTSALETYETAKQSVELNQKIFKNQLQKYEQGMVSSTDLITVNNTLLQSQGSYIQSLYDVMQAQTSLLQLYNKL
ncbi:MAG: TolC family protein [Bacteroidales bacterium]|nr:TolC family protein [Bacteroidales bacterium]